MARSAVAVSPSLSVAELLPGVGSVTPAGAVTVAVLLSVPVAAAEMGSEAGRVGQPPRGRWTGSFLKNKPEAGEGPPPAPGQGQGEGTGARQGSAHQRPL